MVHGHDFEKMYQMEDGFSLENMVIHSVLFDENDSYAGMIL